MEKRLDPDKLERLLAPHGFVLNLPEATKNGVSFVRPSALESLYEHILIRPGEVTYAEAVISAATFTSCHACVSERDNRFRAFLSGNSPFLTSSIYSSAAARTWQSRLVENADAYCTAATMDIGPKLTERLQPVVNAVSAYVQKLGDIFAILDREFAFVAEASAEEKLEIDRLQYLASSWLYLNAEDAKVASLAIVRFGPEIERHLCPFQGKTPRKDDDFGARLILLVDYVRKKRLEYEVGGGSYR
jgi:hypothetical protein